MRSVGINCFRTHDPLKPVLPLMIRTIFKCIPDWTALDTPLESHAIAILARYYSASTPPRLSNGRLRVGVKFFYCQIGAIFSTGVVEIIDGWFEPWSDMFGEYAVVGGTVLVNNFVLVQFLGLCPMGCPIMTQPSAYLPALC